MKTRITEQFLGRFVVELGSTMTKGVQSFAMFNTIVDISDSSCQFKLNFFLTLRETLWNALLLLERISLFTSEIGLPYSSL